MFGQQMIAPPVFDFGNDDTLALVVQRETLLCLDGLA